MTVLVTGADGQLGREFVDRLTRASMPVTGIDVDQLDLLDLDKVPDAIAGYAADWVIHCAAYTQVDRAEDDSERVLKVNRDGARAVARGVRRSGGRLVYISTDFVFGGDKSSPYTEEDTPAPVSVYGQSKWQGEQAVAEELPGALILRTGWVFGVHGKNFVKTILRLASDNTGLRVVDDQVGTPTWTADIVRAATALMSRNAEGIVHFSNEGVASWYDFASEILERARAAGFSVGTEKVTPIATGDYPTRARRPAYSVLRKTRVREQLDFDIPHWRSSLSAMLEQLKEQ